MGVTAGAGACEGAVADLLSLEPAKTYYCCCFHENILTFFYLIPRSIFAAAQRAFLYRYRFQIILLFTSLVPPCFSLFSDLSTPGRKTRFSTALSSFFHYHSTFSCAVVSLPQISEISFSRHFSWSSDSRFSVSITPNHFFTFFCDLFCVLFFVTMLSRPYRL